MICTNCGSQNRAGDQFCGNCGRPLPAGGQPPDEGATSGADRAGLADEDTQSYESFQPAPAAGGVVACWNCGRENPATRTFCQQCGERLAAGAVAMSTAAVRTQAPTDQSTSPGRDRRLLAIGGGLLAALVLGGAAWAALDFLGRASGPAATPVPGLDTPTPFESPFESPLGSPIVGESPTPSPTATTTPSPEPTPTATPPIPSPTPPPAASPTPAPPRIVRFERENVGPSEAPLRVDCGLYGGGTVQIRLAWEIANADGVTLAIDGETHGSYTGTTGHDDHVPFECGLPSDTHRPSHSYVLTTTGGVGPPASRELIILSRPPRIDQFSVDLTGVCTDPVDTLPAFVSWQIRFATGAELWIDGALSETFADTQGHMVPIDPFECGSAPHTYQLITTGGYGPPATATEVKAAP